MPKMRTNRSAAKRFVKSKSGRVTRRKAGHRHNLGGKGRSRQRKLQHKAGVDRTDMHRIAVLLPT